MTSTVSFPQYMRLKAWVQIVHPHLRPKFAIIFLFIVWSTISVISYIFIKSKLIQIFVQLNANFIILTNIFLNIHKFRYESFAIRYIWKFCNTLIPLHSTYFSIQRNKNLDATSPHLILNALSNAIRFILLLLINVAYY